MKQSHISTFKKPLLIWLIAVAMSFIGLLFLNPTHATELYQVDTSARALAMGNSYVSIVRDSDSIFYNPAGLGFDKGIYFTFADGRMGLNGADSISKVRDFQNTANFATALANLDGSRLWGGGGAKSVLRIPYMAFGVYNNIDASLAIDIASGPMELNYISDTGYVIGFGANILPFTYFGVTAKQIKRVGNRKTYTPAEVAALTFSQFDADISHEGQGLGFDVGLTFAIDTIVAPAISIVGRNVGGITFDATTTNPAPPEEPEEWIVGASFAADVGIVSITPTLDIRHVTDSDVDLDRKTHLGVELSIPFIDIRAGLHQQYLSYGVGLGLGPLQVDLASWGVNVGDNDTAIEDRRYMAQVTIEFGLGLDLFSGGGRSSSKKSHRGSSSLRKARARRRIKVRR